MLTKLMDDISRFFQVYQSPTEAILAPLPAHIRAELDEELSLLRDSVLNRLSEEKMP